jgi:hypothetical protein
MGLYTVGKTSKINMKKESQITFKSRRSSSVDSSCWIALLWVLSLRARGLRAMKQNLSIAKVIEGKAIEGSLMSIFQMTVTVAHLMIVGEFLDLRESILQFLGLQRRVRSRV